MKARVLIEISGGVAYVTSDNREIDIALIDYDVESCPVPQTIRNSKTGFREQVAISQEVIVDPQYVDQMFMQL